HNDVVQKVLRRARKGTRVVFIPGNHDEMARQFHGLNFGDIEVAEDAVHVTATCKRLWVVHGVLFHGVTPHARCPAHVRDSLSSLLPSFHPFLSALIPSSLLYAFLPFSLFFLFPSSLPPFLFLFFLSLHFLFLFSFSFFFYLFFLFLFLFPSFFLFFFFPPSTLPTFTFLPFSLSILSFFFFFFLSPSLLPSFFYF
ncbi:hypothetical protein, partial [Escherichia coli]|uniref:hypothetical protein n=1 Tax=Escherichia coli TaxID=562 RepID=UPI001AEFE957